MKYTLLFTAFLLSVITNAQNLEWAKTITGPGTEQGGAVAIDHSGNIILKGNMLEEVDLDPGDKEFKVAATGSKSNSFIAKYSPSGNFLWGGAFTCKESSFSGIIASADMDNNVIITGSFFGEADLDPSAGEYLVKSKGNVINAFITKLDSNGKFLWAKTFAKSVHARGIITDEAGNFYVSGIYTDTVDLDPGEDTAQYISVGPADGFMAKYNNNGEFIWAHTLICPEATNRGFGVSVTDMVLKSSGELLATGTFGDKTVFDEYEEGIALTPTAQLYDAYFLELNVEGKLNWVKQIASEGYVMNPRIELFSNDSIFVSGKFFEFTDFDPSPAEYKWYDFGYGDVFYAKYAPNGDFVKVFAFGGQSAESITEMVIDQNDHIYMTGQFLGPCGLTSFGGLDTSITPNGNSDIYLVQYNTRGELICARKFGYEFDADGTPQDFPWGLGLTKKGNVIYYGAFVAEYDMDPNEGETILTPNGKADLVFAEFSPCSDGVGASSIRSLVRHQIKAYPNPTNGIINLDLPDHKNAIITITDVHGRNIDFVRNNKSIDISSAVNGIYFGTVQINNVVQSFRIIKQ